MVGNRACSERIASDSTVPSPTPASNSRSAGGAGCRLPSSSENPVGDLGLLAAGRDEQQIFLPVVEEPESGRRDVGRDSRAIDGLGRGRLVLRRRRPGPLLRYKAPDLLTRPVRTLFTHTTP